MFNGQQQGQGQGQQPPQGSGGGNGNGNPPPQRNIQAFLQQLITMDAPQRQRYFTQYPQLQMILQQYEQQRRQRMAQFQQGQGQGQGQQPPAPQGQPQQQQQQQQQQQPQQQVPPSAPSQQQQQSSGPALNMRPNQGGMMPQQQQPIVPPQQPNINYMNPNSAPVMNMQMQQRMQQQQQQLQQQQQQHRPPQQMAPGVPVSTPTPMPQPAPKRSKKKKSVAENNMRQGPISAQGHAMGLQQQQLTQAQIQAQIQAAQIQRAQGQQPPIPVGQQPPKMMAMQNNGIPPPGSRLPPQQQQHLVPQKPPAPQVPPPEQINGVNYWSSYLERESKPVATNILMYEQIIDRDIKYLNALEEDKTNVDETNLMNRLINEVKFYNTVRDSRFKIIQDKESGGHSESIWGEGYQGYGNGFTDKQKTQLILPDQAKRHAKFHPKYVSPEDTMAQANRPEELVPIRLEFDLERDKFRLTDTFLWNLNENTISVEELVHTIADDFKFKNDTHYNTLVQSIKEQLNEYHPMIYPKASAKNKVVDLRIPIKLDITIGNNRLTDRFEWDVINAESDPEDFAKVLCEELSLPGEFVSAVSHSIREQTQIFVRALYMIGYKFDGSPVDGDEVRRFIGPTLDPASVVRPRYLLADWSTSLAEVNFTESERLDKEREREARRKRRGQLRVGRRGGAVLPDLTDVPKTFRTPIISSVFVGGVNIDAPADGFVDTLLGVEIPKEQIEAFEEFKEKERLNAIKRQDEALQRQNMEQSGYYGDGGNGRVQVISSDYNSFVVSIKYK